MEPTKEQNAAHGFTEGSEVPQKDANLCPVMDHYYCFNRACGINHEKQCLMINPKDKIYVDGSKVGDYIQQHIAFRREMEMNYAKMQGELTRLRSELQDTKDYFEKQQKHLIDEHFNDLQQERENVIREVMEEFDALEYAKYTVLEINQVLQSLIAKSKAK